MFDLSQKAAEDMFGWSNILLIIGTIMILMAAVGSFWSSTVKEKYSTEQSAIANERADLLKRETEALRAEAEQAKAETARVNERIQKMQALRRLSTDQVEIISGFLRSEVFQSGAKATIQVASVSDSESQMYAMEFLTLLKSAGINVYPTPGGNLPNEIVQVMPLSFGVRLSVSEDVAGDSNHRFFHLLNILRSSGVEVEGQLDPELNSNQAVINILRKPL